MSNRKYYSIDAGRCVINAHTGCRGMLKHGSEHPGGTKVKVVGRDWETAEMTDDDFERDWKLLNYTKNKHGQEIHIGSVWFVESHADQWFPERSWIFEIERIGQFGLTLKTVNWKRNGTGSSTTFGADDLDINRQIGEGVRPATDEEIKYFNKRLGRL